MQNSKAIIATAFAIITVSILVQYGIRPLPVAKPKLIPIQNFPRYFSSWYGGDLEPIDAEIKRSLKTARITDRSYSNQAGEKVDLLLLTATDYHDIHNPADCLPNQGWEVTSSKRAKISGQEVAAMTVKMGTSRLIVIYWYVGHFAPKMVHNSITKLATAIHDRATESTDHGMSLFVRLIADDSPGGNCAVMDFARKVQPPIRILLNKAGGSNLK